jgi:hypothetical protein
MGNGSSISQKATARIGTSAVARYLEGLAAACLESARNLRLLGTLLGILRLAPRTLLELLKSPCG